MVRGYLNAVYPALVKFGVARAHVLADWLGALLDDPQYYLLVCKRHAGTCSSKHNFAQVMVVTIELLFTTDE